MKICKNCITPEDCEFHNCCEIEESDNFDDLIQNKELDFESEDDSLNELLDDDFDLDEQFDDYNDLGE